MLVPAAAVIIVLTTMSLRSLAEAPLVGRDGAGWGGSEQGAIWRPGLGPRIQSWGPASSLCPPAGPTEAHSHSPTLGLFLFRAVCKAQTQAH